MPPLDAPEDDPTELPYRRFGIPKLGFENYWNPILLSRQLGRKPQAVQMLGRDIVLFRDAGRVFAMADRCPHRGVKLSLGECAYRGSGTISCPYHGWTFDGASGRLVAAIMDGPEAPITRKVTIATYPVREHAGIIWVFVGSMEAVPLEDDLPGFIADQEHFFTIATWVDYDCNWRWLVDNWPHDHHGPYAHRNSPELAFQPSLPFAMKVVTKPLPEGRGITMDGQDGITSAEYPGLGSFPPKEWWRVMKKSVGRGQMTGYEESKAYKTYGIPHQYETRLPGTVVVGRHSGEYCLVQWATPLDAHRTRCFNINLFRRMGFWRGVYDRLHYHAWRGWAHDGIFSNQDKRLVEAVVAGPELLSKSDAGVIAWRKYAGEHARRPPERMPAAAE